MPGSAVALTWIQHDCVRCIHSHAPATKLISPRTAPTLGEAIHIGLPCAGADCSQPSEGQVNSQCCEGVIARCGRWAREGRVFISQQGTSRGAVCLSTGSCKAWQPCLRSQPVVKHVQTYVCSIGCRLCDASSGTKMNINVGQGTRQRSISIKQQGTSKGQTAFTAWQSCLGLQL